MHRCSKRKSEADDLQNRGRVTGCWTKIHNETEILQKDQMHYPDIVW